MPHFMKDRLHFGEDTEILELDLSGLDLRTAAQANAVFDYVEDNIIASGENLWFFAVNLFAVTIAPEAWKAYAHRKKKLLLAHSMGVVRYNATTQTAALFEQSNHGGTGSSNLFANRADALAAIAQFQSVRQKTTQTMSDFTTDDLEKRVSFDPERQILSLDFSHLTLHHGADVDRLFDYILQRIHDAGGGRWFVLVNFDRCVIEPAARPHYAVCGKKLNLDHGLGTVRYSPNQNAAIALSNFANTQDFRPNICTTRAAAIARIDAMRAEHTRS